MFFFRRSFDLNTPKKFNQFEQVLRAGFEQRSIGMNIMSKNPKPKYELPKQLQDVKTR